jgi:hypothetical protein
VWYIPYVKFFSTKWWKESWKNWCNGGPLLPPPPKIIKVMEWNIQPDITTYELAILYTNTPRIFTRVENIKEWYNKFPDNVKRHIKLL